MNIMKKYYYVVLSLILFAKLSFASGDYHKNMERAMELWGQHKTVEALAIFERVASVEKNEWIPDYYVGLICAIDIFEKRNESQSDLLLKKAKVALENAIKKSPNNPELYNLKAFILTAEITLNPMMNGRRLSSQVIENYKKALHLDGNNPRALYLLADYQINMAKMFGGDTSKYYAQLEKAVEKFNTFKQPVPFYPNWGKEMAVQILKQKNK